LGLFKTRKPPLRSVLFVCTANVTRSPAAAILFRKAAFNAREQWEVGSAGVDAAHGIGPQPVVANEMKRRWGISIFEHRSRPVTRKLLHRYYWIIAMTRDQRDRMVKAAPDLANRILVLREIGLPKPPDEPDMPDPTGKEADDFSELFGLLETEIPRIFKALQNKVSDLGWQ